MRQQGAAYTKTGRAPRSVMDCGVLPICVPVGCSCALWRLLRVVVLGEFGQVCPFGKWGRGL